MSRRRDFGSITQRPDRDGFYVRFSLNGREYLRHGGMTRAAAASTLAKIQTLVEAHARHDEVLAAVFGDPVGSKVSFQKIVPTYLKAAKERLRASTLFSDAAQFRVIFRAAWTQKSIGAITTRDIERWIEERKASGASGSTCNRNLALISAVYRWAIRVGHVDENPVRRIPRYSEKGKARTTHLSAMQVCALLACAEPWFLPFLECACATGMRRNELLKLCGQDLDFVRREIFIRPENEKAGRGRVVPMTSELEARLLAYRVARGSPPADERVFVWKDGKPFRVHHVRMGLVAALRHCDAIPMDKRTKTTAHTLRHSFASIAVANGISIFDVASLLGNSVAICEKHYAHFSPEHAGRVAIDKLGRALSVGAVSGARPDEKVSG